MSWSRLVPILPVLLAECVPPRAVEREREPVPATTPDTRTVALERARKAFESAREARDRGDREEARSSVGQAIDLLVALPQDLDASEIALRLYQLGNLARQLGALEPARAAFEWSAAQREKALPSDHPDILQTWSRLASTRYELGDYPGAAELEERVVAGLARTLPPDDGVLLAARQNLAASRADLGDMAGARELIESVIAIYEHKLPDDHPDLLKARGNLAVVVKTLGDLPRARDLEERVLAAYERDRAGDDPERLALQRDLADTRSRMGDHAAARELQERTLEAYARVLPPDHLDVLSVKQDLASTFRRLGDVPAALRLLEELVAISAGRLGKDHTRTLTASIDLASVRRLSGDAAGARSLLEPVLGTCERTLSEEDPNLGSARLTLAALRRETGDEEGAAALLPQILSGVSARTHSACLRSPREAQEVVGSDADALAAILLLDRDAGPEARARTWELLELRRRVAGAAASAAGIVEADASIAALSLRARVARERIQELVVAGGDDAQSLAAEIGRWTAERDRAESGIARELARRGRSVAPISVATLAASLPPGAAAVSYLRQARWRLDPASRRIEVGPDELLAHVVKSDGSLTRLELGPAGDLEELVGSWRSRIGSPVDARGVGVRAKPAERAGSELEAGESLRRKLLDPVLAAAGPGIRAVHLCPDDLVFLVPLDALPEGGGRVGDRLRILVQPFFDAGAPGRTDSGVEAELVVVGAVDYGQASSGGEDFTPLPGTLREVDAVAALFEKTVGLPATRLLAEQAGKSEVLEQAPRARFLHVATHGWFLEEAPAEDPERSRGGVPWRPTAFGAAVGRLAPMTLCGLALAGANLNAEGSGSGKGILTAEELCSLDLSRCEMAVLSACETNVGIRRAGLGIQSLQTALLAAGARAAVTSLWRVDDAATCELMERFYAHLWREKLPAAEALWKAKQHLRASGRPIRDWAGWVYSGRSDAR